MAAAKITSKGQITIPKRIRDYLRLEAGSQVDFVLDEKGQVTLIPLDVSIESLSGFLHRPNMKTATIAEMEKAIQEGASDWD